MAEDAIIRLRAIDETGGPMSRVVARMRQTQAALRGSMAETAREYDRQGRAADRAGRTAEDAHRRAARAARQHADSMASMLAGYARGAITIEAARRAFLGFADTDERLRRLQNQAGASRAEIEKLAPALRALARSTGYSMEELTTSFDDFRDSLELSVPAAQKVFPSIAKGALAAGVPVKDMGDVIVRTMLNMKVAGKDIPRIIDQWVKAGEDHHIQVGKIASALPRLTEVMGHWGYEGTRGNAALLAWLASLHKVTGSSEEAGQALSDLFEAMTNPGVIQKLGHTPDSMEQGLRRAAKAGKDPISVFLALVKAQEKYGQSVETIFTKPGLRRYVRTLLDGIGEVPKKINDIDDSLGRANKSAENMAAGPKHAWNVLTNSLIEARDALGEVLVSLGTTAAIQSATADLGHLTKAIGTVAQTLKVWNEAIETGSLSKLAKILQLDWKQILTLLPKLNPAGNITGRAIEFLGKRGSQTPEEKLPSDDIQSGKGDKLSVTRPGARDVPWKLTDEEEKEIERKRKLNEAAERLDQIFRRMSFTLEDWRGGEPRVMKASYGGGGLGGYGGGYGGSGGGPGGGGGGFGPGGSWGGRGGGGYGGHGPGSMAGGPGGIGGPAGGPGDGPSTLSWPSTAEGHPTGSTGLPSNAPFGGGTPFEKQTAPGGGLRAWPGEGGVTAGGVTGDLDRSKYGKMFAGTPLAGKYDKVVETANANGISPNLMASIMAHETAKGRSNMLRTRNNPAGLMDPKTGMRTGQNFSTIEAGIDAAGRVIAKNYRRAGGDINRLGSIYAPVGAANDPGGLNSSWPGGVRNYMRQLGGSGTSRPSSAGAAGLSSGIGQTPFGASSIPMDASIRAMAAGGGSSGPGGSWGPPKIRAGRNMAGVNPVLMEAVRAGSAALPEGYTLRPTSGVRGGDSGFHGTGMASDWQIYDPQGKPTPNRGEDYTGLYQRVGQAAYGHLLQTNPKAAAKFNWGGAHSVNKGGPGAPDLMHYDLGGKRGRYSRYRLDNLGPIYPPKDAESKFAKPNMTEPEGDWHGLATGGGGPSGGGGGPSHRGASLRDRARAGRGEEDGGGSSVDDAKRARQELERPIKVNMDMGGATQFGRASMRREADREVREARFNSMMDIGAA